MIAQAQSVTLAWDPSPDNNISGYHVHYGLSSGNYTEDVPVGNVTQATLSGLAEGTTYYIVVTAENSLGLESLPSNELVHQIPAAQINNAPVVNAGPDRAITLPATASLSGSVTDDGLPNPPGATTRTWSKVSGPGTVTFANASAASTVASFSSAGTYVLRLTANDGDLGTSDTVSVVVSPANQAPLVNAGPDRAITLPATASLSGSVTDDGLPNPPGVTSVSWSKVGGPGTVNFASASSAATSASFSTAGSYVLRLTASDGALSASDDVTVTVAANLAPIANSQSHTLNMNTPVAITLTGSDPNGDAIGFSLVTTPAHGALSGFAPNVTYTPASGYYGNDSFSFSVSDGSLSSAPAVVSLSIESTLPIVSIAASDPTATEPGADSGTFTVSRAGHMDEAVTVDYLISGSALYGTDYQAIPTSITIPAGAVSANLTLWVSDDSEFEPDEQVTLALAASSSYVIGSASSATVTIEDDDNPVLSITSTEVPAGGSDRTPGPVITEEQLNLHAPAVPGIAYILQCTTNLVDWVGLATNAVGAPMDFIDINTGNFKSRLYRVVYVQGQTSDPAIASAQLAGDVSANIVGVVNVTAAPGMTLIANPLINNAGNDLNVLLSDVPVGTQFFVMGGGNKYRTYKFEGPGVGWKPNGNVSLEPGDGAFVRNNTPTNLSLSFIGEVDTAVTQPVPRDGQYSIASCPLPVAADINSIVGVTPADGDQVYTYVNGTPGITSAFSSTSGTWSPVSPYIQPGESFLYYRSK